MTEKYTLEEVLTAYESVHGKRFDLEPLAKELTTPKFAEGQVVTGRDYAPKEGDYVRYDSNQTWGIPMRSLNQTEVGVKNWVPRAEFDKLREAYTGTLCLIGNQVWKSAEDQAFINSICEDGSATLDAIPEDLK